MNIEHLLGKIHQGDCLEFMRQLPDKCVDLVLTDPPYGIDIGGSGKIGGSGYVEVKDYGKSEWDKSGMTAYQWIEIQRIGKRWVVWGGNHLADVMGKSAGVLVWDKKCQNGWDDTFSEMEIAWTNLFTRTKGFRHLWAGALRASEQGANVRQHPTQKPISLMGWCLEFDKEARIVFDPFMGSGTTAVACERLGRKWFGCELEPKYCDIANKRIEAERSQLKLF